MTKGFRCAAFACLLMGCASGHETPQSILPPDCRLETGDVVFRRGGSLLSQVVLAADAHGNYSHLGIVVDSAGVKMVVHAVPGEPDFPGDPDRVKMDPPERFFLSTYAMMGEVCRPHDPAVARRAAEVAMRQYRRGTRFDHDYDNADTTRMYCTELVVYAFRQAGHDVIGDVHHEVELPFLHAQCIFPSDVYASDFLESVYMFNK